MSYNLSPAPSPSTHSPVVAKVLLLDVPDGERVTIGSRVHDAPIGRLDGEGVLVPGHLQGAPSVYQYSVIPIPANNDG